MKKSFHTYRLAALCLLILSSTAFLLVQHASALTVSPARIEITGDPGETVTSQFDLINEQEDAQTFYSSSENFQAQGESGTPSFVPGDDGLASWITLAPTVTLDKGQEEKVPFTITIPKTAEPGGYFAAVFLSTTPTSGAAAGQVSVGARIGVLVLLKVSGDAKEGGGLLGFSTLNGQRFFTSPPISLYYRFQNDGSDRIEPTGTVDIKDTAYLTVASFPANSGQGNILPTSIRRFDLQWGDSVPPTGFFPSVFYQATHFAFGFYDAQLMLNYGTKGESARSSFLFFVFPWQLVLTILVILFILGFIFTRGMRSYNRYIIAQAQATSAKNSSSNQQ